MKFWSWQPGRQGTGYRKMLLAEWKFFDLYLIDYPPGSNAPIHTDKVLGHKHHRANLVLYGPTDAFQIVDQITDKVGRAITGGRLNIFRPDIEPHRVLASHKRRVVLSLGWIT